MAGTSRRRRGGGLVVVVAWALQRPGRVWGKECVGREALGVDLFLGTGGDGHTHPGATRPFGMVQVSPSNGVKNAWSHCSGYHYNSGTLAGLTHTALSGTGLGDMGDVLLRPRRGEEWRKVQEWRLDHERECATPGYYSIDFEDCRLEATATVRAGLTRLTCGRTPSFGLRVDATWGQNSKTTLATARISTFEGRPVIAGLRKSEGFGRRRGKAARCLKTTYYACAAETDATETRHVGKGVAEFFLSSPVKTQATLEVRCGLSWTSTAAALRNLRNETAGRSFETVATAASKEWRALLVDDFRVEARVSVDASVLRTALYHTLLTPNVVSDADGGAPSKFGGNRAPAYSTLSLWDTFRAQMPWLTLYVPEIASEIADSMARYGATNRRLPKWLLADAETDVMIGYHGVAVLADAILKGLVTELDAATRALLDTVDGVAKTTEASFVDAHARLKPASSLGGQPEVVSTGLEISVDDACAARALRYLRRPRDAARLARRAKAYSAYFDPNVGYFRGQKRRDTPFDPYEVHYAHRPDARDFTEGSPAQYLFTPGMVDPEGLARLLSSSSSNTETKNPEDALLRKLDDLFEPSNAPRDASARDVTGCLGQHCVGNEVVHHVAYLYAAFGHHHLTQRRLDDVLNKHNLFGSGPRGLPGNDDCGQMSAWLLLNAIGLFPRDPCRPRWDLGRPLVNAVNISLPDNRALVSNGNGGDSPVLRVVVHDQAPDRPYVDRVYLNGRRLHRGYIRHSELRAGPRIDFFMRPDPPPRPAFAAPSFASSSSPTTSG